MTPPLPLDDLLQLARDAGDAILKIYNTDFEVERKQDNSPLTEADLASHRTIVATLERLTPDIPVLSEESASIPFETRRDWQRYQNGGWHSAADRREGGWDAQRMNSEFRSRFHGNELESRVREFRSGRFGGGRFGGFRSGFRRR